MNRPRSVVCYICGREYGTASIEIHIKSCTKKWENEQLQKPKKDRRPLPQPPQKIGGVKNMTNQQLEEFNNQNFQNYNETALVPCENCGRTFREEALAHHVKGCSAKNPYKAGAEKQGDLVPCGLCGRKFAAERVQKHESVCKGGSSGGGAQQTSSPQKSFGSGGSTQSPQKSFGSPQKQPTRPKTIMCYICGREFGTKSLSIHMKTCKEKFTNEQMKKPKSERKSLPQEPAGLQQLLSKSNITHQDIEEYNNMAFNKYNTDMLEPCPNCARTFTAEALSHHIKACKPKHGAQSKASTSSPMKEKVIKKPKVVMCHICGREYGTASISIHIPQCEKKWINEQNKLPPNQRKPVPQPPKQMIDLSNATQDQIDKFNQDAYQNYNDQAMTACPYCNRTFTSEAFKHHQKACTKDKPMAAVKPIKNVDAQKIGGRGSDFQVNEFSDQPVDLTPCSKCGRKFNPDRIAKHEGICKGK